MNIDEFLDSDKTREKIEKTNILKIKYSENIYFIYKPEYGEFEYGRKLEFLGLYEKITKKLYGSILDFNSDYNKDLKSNYFAGSISDIGEKLIEGANIYLKKYIEENKLYLVNNSKRIFDRFIKDENNSKTTIEDAIHNYIYKENDIETNFSINDYDNNYYKQYINDLIVEYIQNPIETSKKVFNEYISNKEIRKSLYINGNYEEITVREWIGVMLQKKQYKDLIIHELIDNPNNEYKKKQEIIQSIKDLDAKFITITVRHNDKFCTFKYPQNLLYNMDFYEWHIPDLKIREQMKNLYKDISWNKDEIFMKEIVKIEYSRKVLYEDNELLNIENNIQETHDIVDDMFD